MIKVYLSLVFSLFLIGESGAQLLHPKPVKGCSQSPVPGRHILAKTTVADTAEDHYDIKHVALDLELSNISNFVIGNVTTNAVVTASSLPAFVFELSSYMVVDSVKINGQLQAATGSGVVRTVSLPTPLPQGSSFAAQVFYHGQPPAAPGFFSYGIRNDISPSWQTQVTYTLSQPYDARDWWPVKQALKDKIDSASIWLTVPDTCLAGSNGLLKAVVPVPGSKLRFEWETRYPIDYYLLSAAVAPYVDYSYYIHFPGTNDSMLYQNYVYNNPQTLPTWKWGIDTVAGMLLHFSDLFGRYPFWQEKYGHAMAPLSGGMEHQTMTTLGFFTPTLTAHELGHQWFGDNVTCATWKDIWLNEGFASYAEYLYVDHFVGAFQARGYMADVHDDVLSDPSGALYVDDTSNENRIFDSRLSYNKGSAVVHMLRYELNDDSLFFQMLQDYQDAFRDSTATTEEFRTFAEQASGQSLDTFFQQWVYKEGYPYYSARWNQVDSIVYVELTQVASLPSSQTLFRTPLDLELESATGDTVVRVYNNQNVQTFSFVWHKTMQDLSIDPDNWILNITGPILKDVTLDTDDVHNPLPFILPNPAVSSWQVLGLREETTLSLFDLNGRLVWSGTASGIVSIPASQLTAGMYILKLNSKNTSASVKLIKQ